MSGFAFLDLILGLSFIYFVVSLGVTVVQELRANVLRLRFRNLEQWIDDTFDKGGLAQKLKNHDLIKQLVRKGRNPSYIPNQRFIAALLDLVHQEYDPDKSYNINTLKKAVESSESLPEDLKRYISQLISESAGELKYVRDTLADWFDNAMDRIGGTYKVINQKAIIVISFVLVVFMNVDTIQIARYLYNNPEERAAISTSVQLMHQDSTLQAIYREYVEQDTIQDSTNAGKVAGNEVVSAIRRNIDDLGKLQDNLSSYGLPMGWDRGTIEKSLQPFDWGFWINKFIGLLISTLAVSVGAPFWYDLINKLVNIRSAGTRPKNIFS